jgi:group I intron endonuclease
MSVGKSALTEVTHLTNQPVERCEMANAIVSGIYRIEGPNGKFYVGSAKRISRRWIEHKRDLRKGDHANPKLQCAWNKHGESAFRLVTLELVESLDDLLNREQFWIDTLDAVNCGYNVLQIAGSNLGMKMTEETKRKMSAVHTGRKHGPMSEEQKAYFSELYKGKKLSEETRRRMSAARKGGVVSDETRNKISEAHKGKKKSEEHKANLAAANIGKKASPETIAKMKLAHSQRPKISESTRIKLREAALRRYS